MLLCLSEHCSSICGPKFQSSQSTDYSLFDEKRQQHQQQQKQQIQQLALSSKLVGGHQEDKQSRYSRERFVSEQDKAAFQPFKRSTKLMPSTSLSLSAIVSSCVKAEPHLTTTELQTSAPAELSQSLVSDREFKSRDVVQDKAETKEGGRGGQGGGRRTASKKRREFRSRKMVDEVDEVSGTPRGERCPQFCH